MCRLFGKDLTVIRYFERGRKRLIELLMSEENLLCWELREFSSGFLTVVGKTWNFKKIKSKIKLP